VHFCLTDAKPQNTSSELLAGPLAAS